MKTMPSPSCQQKITVLIADDHTVVREGIRELLRTAPDIEVVGEAGSGGAVITQAYRLCPAVILLDIAMPDVNGITAARELGHTLPRSRIVMLSTYHGDDEVNAAVQAGACSYLTKESASADLIRAVRETAQGHSFFSPLISRRVFRRGRRAHRH
jgi:DNA-binding NarL/FixJ family response regulator